MQSILGKKYEYARDMHFFNESPEQHTPGDGRYYSFLNDLLHHYHCLTKYGVSLLLLCLVISTSWACFICII